MKGGIPIICEPKKNNFKNVFKRLVYYWPAIIYIIWFSLLEKAIPDNGNYVIMHCFIDDIIPFCEYFIIPYFMWFPLMGAVFIFFLFTSDEECKYASKLIIGGMLASMAICTIIPNGQDLRPDISEIPDSFFGSMAASLYSTDTATNVCPSVHVYNSAAACIALFNCGKLRNKKYIYIKIFAVFCAVMISLSTMFLKQHSAIDVICALILAVVMYLLVYKASFILKSKEEKIKPIFK